MICIRPNIDAIRTSILEITKSSFTPASTNFSASRSIARGGRLFNFPRMSGIMQNLHL